MLKSFEYNLKREVTNSVISRALSLFVSNQLNNL